VIPKAGHLCYAEQPRGLTRSYVIFFRPYGAEFVSDGKPRADALGYTLSPLRARSAAAERFNEIVGDFLSPLRG